MNKIFKTVLFASLLLGGLVINLPAIADIGPSMDVSANTLKIKNLVVLSVYDLELPGNPQNPAIDNKGQFALVPAKDLDIIYYVQLVKGNPVLLQNTIPTGKAPVAVAISNNSRRAYVANEMDDTVTVISLDEEDSKVESVINVGDRPHDLALGKNGRYLYVLNRGEDTVFVVDTDNEEYPVVNKINVGEWPNSIKISNSGQSAFVVNRGGNSVTEINLQDPLGAVLEEDILVGTYPIDVALSSDSNIALVTNGLDNNISIFTPVEATRAVFGRISNLEKPFGIASDYLNDIAVAVSYDDNKVHYFDLSASGKKVVSQLKHTKVKLTEKPEFVAINGKSGTILLSHPKRDNLTVINFKIDVKKIDLKKPEKKSDKKFQPAFRENELRQEQQIEEDQAASQQEGQQKVNYPQGAQLEQAEEVLEDLEEKGEEE